MGADGLAGRPAPRLRSQSAPDAVAPAVLAAQVSAGMLRRIASAASSDFIGGGAKRPQ
jgi:hypothetical protein